jgi:hypothetical protein
MRVRNGARQVIQGLGNTRQLGMLQVVPLAQKVDVEWIGRIELCRLTARR